MIQKKTKSIFLTTLIFVALILAIKFIIMQLTHTNENGEAIIQLKLTELIELSDAGIVFTGAFFVMGLMLAATMSDFKESEKIPGEVACNLEIGRAHV